MAGRSTDKAGAAAAALARAYGRYQDKLLSITSRNRSVVLRRIYTAHSCDLAVLEHVTPGAATRIMSRAIRDALSARQARAEHAILGGSARGDDADRLRGRLKTLARNLGRIEEETGQQAGYLGFPFLVGYAAPGLYVRGPVALFPVSLVPRQGGGRAAGGWSVRFQGQAPIVNSSLFMALKKRAGNQVPDGYEEQLGPLVEEMEDARDLLEDRFFAKIGGWLRRFLPMDDSIDDPRSAEVAPLTKADIGAMAPAAEPLRLVGHKVVGSFPVADSKIYDDYTELIRRAGEPRHELIAGLLDIGGVDAGQGADEGEAHAGGAAAGGGGGRPRPRHRTGAAAACTADIIDGAASSSLNAVLPSDSSQDAVMLESQGSSITVVRGPPGTGKSQVIVNLVSDALMRGERVAVVCQKRAALEVVKQRLDCAGLGRYSVFLEREDDRPRMYGQLCDIIEGRQGVGGQGQGEGDIAEVYRAIDSHVQYLRGLGRALHAKLDGASAYDLYARADGSYAAVLDLDGLEGGGLPEWGRLEGYLARMAGVEDAVRRFDDPAGPWRGRKSFAALTNRDKGRIRDAVRRMHEGCAASVLLGSRGDQSRLAAVLGMCASAGRPDHSMSAEIEDAIHIGAAPASVSGADADPAAAFCAKMAGDVGRAQASASGALAEEQREAGDALAGFVGQYRLWEEASSLHRLAGDSMLVGGRREQEALAAALESYTSSLRPDRAPTPAEIEGAIRIGAAAAGAGVDADPAAAFCAKMAADMARASGRENASDAGGDGAAAVAAAAGPAPSPAPVAAALSEFAGLCASRSRVRELARHAQGLLAGSLRDQGALVSALESYAGDRSILKRKKRRAYKEIAGLGLDPESIVGGGEDAGRALARARAGLEFWLLLSAPPVPGDPESLRPVALAAERRSDPGAALSEAEKSIERDMDANALSLWAKHMIRTGAESAQDAVPFADVAADAHDSATAAQAYMDDPSPLSGAPARGAVVARQEGGPGPDGKGRRGALEAALRTALARSRETDRAGPVPKMPDAAHYRGLAESALSEFAALHRASEQVRCLARLAPMCALARTPGGQARLPGLYEAARRGGLLAGRRRKRAAAEIAAIVSIPPADPERAAEASARGSEFWAAWPEAESAARGLGVAGSKAALEGRAQLESYLGNLLRSIDGAMEKNRLAGWAKRLYGAGAEAARMPDGDGGGGGEEGSAAAAAAEAVSACARMSRELCGELAIVEPGSEDPVAAAAAEANRYAAALASGWIEPVRRGAEFWSAYSRLCAMPGPSPEGGAAGPQEALDEILRARDASCRLVAQSPVSEWAKILATSARLRGEDGGGDAKGRRADAEKVARLYMADPGLLAAGRRTVDGDGGRAADADADAADADAADADAADADAADADAADATDTGAPPGDTPDTAGLLRLLFAELGRKGTTPELPALPGANTARLYEAMIANALSPPSSPGAGGPRPARWVEMLMECALPGGSRGPDGPPDPRSIPPRRASSPGFLELDEGDPVHRMAASMRAAAERIAAGSIPAVESGMRVWDALNDIGAFFDRGVPAAAAVGAGAAPGDAIESFAAGAMADLEGDALDDMQELDKKKSEYEPSIFKLLEMARAGAGPGRDWTGVVRREIYAHWIDRIERAYPVLQGRPIDNYNSHAAALASLAADKRGLVVREIRRRIESIRPRDVYGAFSARFEDGSQRAWRDMLGELKKRRRILPIRRLIERYSEQLFRIAPCWLASPESISKAMPLERGLFDLVIVDEASQLAMEKTIPLLYRGKRAVIAGDEKQLPPFDLFQARTDDDGEGRGEEDDGGGEAAEAERRYDEKSLLDLARARHMTTNLAWHYRSRHQGLVDFSNHAFYGGELNVVPDAHSDPSSPPVQWVECDGRWIDRTNAREAAEVVEQIRKAWGGGAAAGPGDGGRMPTVGVITFNEAQQNHILDRIDDARASDAEFGRLYGLAHEGRQRDAALFVKNIENVQGDERDVVIFSVGYAPDADGRFSNRFGPLGLKGGENRLNVAVTRARERMVVVSSIDPSMISMSSEHDGPRRFRQFLEYARAVSGMDEAAQREVLAGLDEATAGAAAPAVPHAADRLGRRIQEALEGAGYTVRTGLGFSGYRIDLAVVDPRDENRYVMGIEYDGPMFRSAGGVMERDVVRPALLRSKGWAFERTWSRSWWKDPGAELARLKARIEEAMVR